MPRYQYLAHHPLQRNRLARLTVRKPVWTEAVNGGSTFTCEVTVPEDPFKIAEIRQATQPDESAIYIRASNGVIPWCGIVKKRSWSRETATLTVTVMEWRAWLYTQILGPKVNLTGNNTYIWTAVDQFQIARDIVNTVTAGGVADGVPAIKVGAETSGILRNLVVLGTSFGTAGATIDSIANLDSGFEWDIEGFTDSDGLPSLKLGLYSPQRGGVVDGLTFRTGGNILNNEDIEESTENRASRVWAVGEGPNAESLPYAVDSDPGIVDGYTLRSDKASAYSGIYNRTVLASYARAERTFLADPLGVVSFETMLATPEVNNYGKGDRCRVIIQDRFNNIDISNVRILERQITPQEGGGKVKLTVNLNDNRTPEVDEGGLV